MWSWTPFSGVVWLDYDVAHIGRSPLSIRAIGILIVSLCFPVFSTIFQSFAVVFLLAVNLFCPLDFWLFIQFDTLPKAYCLVYRNYLSNSPQNALPNFSFQQIQSFLVSFTDELFGHQIGLFCSLTIVQWRPLSSASIYLHNNIFYTYNESVAIFHSQNSKYLIAFTASFIVAITSFYFHLPP